MKFNNGLVRDTNSIEQPQGTWRDARNIVISDERNTIRNEDGFSIYSSNYPSSHTPVGVLEIPDGTHILFSSSPGNSHLGRIDTAGLYTDIINDDRLLFRVAFPIEAEFRFNFRQELIITWIASNTTPKILNVDNPPFTLDGSKALQSDDDLNKILLFPDITAPTALISVSESGGILRTGVYQVLFSYIDSEGFETNYTSIDKPIYVTEDTISEGFNNYDGAPPNTPTSKALAISLLNVDTRYERIRLIVISRIEGVSIPNFVKDIIISGSTLNTTYTGAENQEVLTLQEVLIKRPNYTIAKAITQLNDILYLGNLQQEEDVDLQSIANDIIINYTTKLIDVTNINESQKINRDRGFAHGVVYAFYLQGEYNNGNLTEAFVIPGRISKASEVLNSALATNESITAKVFQVEDTSNSNGQTYTSIGNIQRPTNQTVSNMGYWENETEVYPTDFPDFAGEKVRHHRFPTIRRCKSQHYSTEDGYGREKLDVLGIDVSNVNIPSNIQSRIKKWRILYAKRDISRSNVISQDLLLYSASIENDANVRWSSAGNWRLNAQRAGSGVWLDLELRNDHIRFHGFDLLYSKPAISPLYITLQLELTKSNLNATYQSVGKQGGKIATSGDGRGRVPGAVIDYTDITNTVVDTVSNGNYIRRIDNFRYVPHNIIDGNLYTRLNEEAAVADINNGASLVTASEFFTQSINEAANRAGGGEPILNGNGQENTYLISLEQVIGDIYDSYLEQELVFTDRAQTTISSTTLRDIYGGDTFVSYYSFITAGPMNGGDLTNFDQGLRILRAFVCETANNANLRHEDTADIVSSYYPKTDGLDFWNNPNTVEGTFIYNSDRGFNNIAYNPDYTVINDLNPVVIDNPFISDTNTFPFRVIRSLQANRESQVNSWRFFLSEDFYEQNTNRGEIINLQGYVDVLLIHHKYALFRTIGNETLRTTALEVTIGTGDIFARSPKEVIVDTLGYAGTQHKFSCIVCPLGYVFTDAEQGKIFVLSNALNEISSLGLRNNFRDLLQGNSVNDNPFNNSGITTTWDENFKRLIWTLNTGSSSTSETWSFTSLLGEQGGWVCRHDYIPSFLFRGRDKLFSINTGDIYEHNISTKKGLYYDQVNPVAWFVEVVFNGSTEELKQFFNVNWVSEMFDASDVKILNRTFDTIECKTGDKTTGEVTLVPYSNITSFYNTRFAKGKWNFNTTRTSVVTASDFLNKRKLIDLYMSVKLVHNNTKNLDNSQNTLFLSFIEALVLRSTR